MSSLFISHSSEDLVWCQALVAALRTAGHTCFFDHDSIPGSAEWLDTIQVGVQQCDLCVLALSPVAWTSPWVKHEWQLALRLNKPILPVEYQPTPEANNGFLRQYQWVKAVGLDAIIAGQRTITELARLGYGAQVNRAATPTPVPQVVASIPIPAWLAHLGFTGYVTHGVEYIVPPVCDVPAGPFIMGSKQHDPQAFGDEQPQYKITTGIYQIGVYPLTVAEYACAITANAVKAPPEYGGVTWQKQQQHPDHPVVCVSWLDARAYAAWLTQMTGQAWRLPTEAEWEKAARGTDGRIYPWGNQWDKARANTYDGGPGTTTPIGAYADKEDASPYGAHDMAGNVWEWTSSIYLEKYPYRHDQAEKDADTTYQHVLRGGSWIILHRNARAAFRLRSNPDPFLNCLIGVRVVRGAAAGT